MSMWLLLAACESEDSRWRDAVAEGRSRDFEVFLAEYPDGKHAAKARARLDEIAWNETSSTEDPGAYWRYLDSFADGLHATEARAWIDDHEWQRLSAIGDRPSLEAYLASFPKGSHADDAKEKLVTLDWEDARRLHQVDAYESFAATHPGSQQAPEASRLAGLMRFTGNWALNSDVFFIDIQPDQPVSINSQSARPEVVEESVDQIAVGDSKIAFRHTVEWTRSSRVGGAGNFTLDSAEVLRSEYDVVQDGPDRLRGTLRSGLVGRGSTGIHDRGEVHLYRLEASSQPVVGLGGGWAAESFHGIVHLDVDRDGEISVSKSTALRGSAAQELAYSLEEIHGTPPRLKFSLSRSTSYSASTAVYSCGWSGNGHLVCDTTSSCDGCTSLTRGSAVGRRIRVRQP